MMQKFKMACLISFFSLCLPVLPVTANEESPKEELTNLYEVYRKNPSDINEHMTVLRQLAQESASVIEIGRRSNGSTWALLMGLSESKSPKRSFLEIENGLYMLEKLYLSKKLAKENNIDFRFICDDIFSITIEERADLLFIDSIHTYCHLTYELERFSSKINHYIVMHDTSAPWGYQNDTEYKGDYSEYPASIDRTKKGLSMAITDFLAKNSDWVMAERRFNNHGLIVLKRIED